MHDAGVRLRDLSIADPDFLGAWREILPQYAALQIESIAHAAGLVQAGVPNRRADPLFQWYEPFVDESNPFLGDGQPDGLTRAQISALAAIGPVVAEISGGLAATVPDALHHGDLHDGNIFRDRGRWRFLDWGDSGISHPFYSLRTVKVSVAARFDLAEEASELDALADAYLEPWTRFAPPSALREALALSEVTAPINGAMTWARVIAEMNPETRQDFKVPVPALLEESLDAARKLGLCG